MLTRAGGEVKSPSRRSLRTSRCNLAALLDIDWQHRPVVSTTWHMICFTTTRLQNDDIKNPPSERSSMSLKILLVDDQPDAIVLLVMLLRMEGLDVRGVTTGAEALRVAAEWKPDVICLDLGMPGMNGYDLASRLRRAEALATVRIIAISGYAADPELLGPAGIDMHLLKPVDLAALRRAIYLSVPLRSAIA